MRVVAAVDGAGARCWISEVEEAGGGRVSKAEAGRGRQAVGSVTSA